MAGQLAENGPAPTSAPRVATGFVAVVLSYNACESLAEVLRRIEAQTVRPARTIVVDNGSADGTATMLAADFPAVEAIALPENRGVGAGHRVGWEAALASPACTYVWVLEHDTFTEPGCLEQLEREATRLDAAGVHWGAMNARVERDDAEAEAAVLQHAHPAQGAIVRRRITFNSIVLPRRTIEDLGWPREDFFVGHEDWEYSERLRRAGYKVMLDEHAVVLHPTKGNRRHGVSTSVMRGYYSMRNGVYVDHAVRKQRGSALRWTGWTIGSVAGTLVRQDKKVARSCVWVTALFDGVTGRLGRRDYWFLRR